MLELSAETRRTHLGRMAEGSLDVLVVGGGITGAGVALDAASRGLSVGLVERQDFAAGTSGRSSRLIHGGLRYLPHGEVGLVREASRERGILLRLAPHLITPLPCLVPVRRFRQRAFLRVGLILYDALAGRLRIRRHRGIDEEETATLAPGLARRARGLVYYDAKTDDARLTLEIIRQAVAHGGLVANHAEVEGLLGTGRINGARIRDALTGEATEVRARVIVNATGAWADRIQGFGSPNPTRLRPSKGVHVVLDRRRLPVRSAVFVPSVAGRDAFIFVVPWGPRVWVGTTDTPYDGSLERPPVDPEDEDVLLQSLARAFGGDLSHQDVLASWAGVRPLLDRGAGPTRDLSRRHFVTEEPRGLVTVTGGKLTTYRAMAEEVVDRLCRDLRAGGACRTRNIPLGLSRSLSTELGRAGNEAHRLGLSKETGERLVRRYGDDWEDALALIREDAGLGEEIVPGLPVLRVEASLARSREMALMEDDVLVRRTRLATMDAAAAAAVTI